MPEYEVTTSEVFAGFPNDKDGYGYADSEQEATDKRIFDEGINLLRQETTEELRREIGRAKRSELRSSAGRVVRREGPSAKEGKVGGSTAVLGNPQDGTGVQGEGTGRLEAKEAAKLYDEAAEKFPQVKDAEVSNLVKDGIRQTVDFGKREGDILDSASGNHVRQGVSELRTSARPVLHTLGNNDGRMPVYSEKRFGLIRELALLAE